MKKKIALFGLCMAFIFAGMTKVKGQGNIPEVHLILPHHDVFTGNDVLLKADAKDIDGNILKAEFYLNDTRLGIDNAFPFFFDVKNLQRGTAKFAVNVTDNSGNENTSTSTIDVTDLRRADNPADSLLGLNYKYYEIAAGSGYPSESEIPKAVGATGAFDLTVKKRQDNFSISYSGFIAIKKDGFYTFEINADNQERLYIGGNIVAQKGSASIIGKKVALAKGMHSLKHDYMQKTGGSNLYLAYAGPGFAKKNISPRDLYHTGNFSIPNFNLRGPSTTSRFQAYPDSVYFETFNITGIAKAEFYQGSTLLGTKYNNHPIYGYDFGWKRPAPGYYHLSARAYTPNGEVSYTNVHTVLVEGDSNIPSTVSLQPL